jgi:hypothetical protein
MTVDWTGLAIWAGDQQPVKPCHGFAETPTIPNGLCVGNAPQAAVAAAAAAFRTR